jgi:hypothetical protein
MQGNVPGRGAIQADEATVAFAEAASRQTGNPPRESAMADKSIALSVLLEK